MRTFVISLLMLFSMSVSAQEPTSNTHSPKVALKTNLLMDALLSPNIGVEYTIAPRWTMDVSTQINAWTLSHQRRWKHWFVQPEVRWWATKPFSGHFIAINAIGGVYNISNVGSDLMLLGTNFKALRDNRYQGWMMGAGIAYGYAWRFSQHFTLEGEIGIGYTGTHYKQFQCAGCGKLKQDHLTHNYYGPTKAAVNLVYDF